MIIEINPAALSGNIHAPFSKSDAHRVLIAAALSRESTFLTLSCDSEDIRATVRCLEALGARLIPLGSTVVADVADSAETLPFSQQQSSVPRRQGKISPRLPIRSVARPCANERRSAIHGSADGSSPKPHPAAASCPDNCNTGASDNTNETSYRMEPIWNADISPYPKLDCGESGTTLRLLLPIAAALVSTPCISLESEKVKMLVQIGRA